MKGLLTMRVWLLIIALFCSSIAHADFSLGEGYYCFAARRHLDNTTLPFGALTYHLTNQLGIEGLVGWFVTQSHAAVNDDQSANGGLFALDVIYTRWPDWRYVPYLLAGPGLLSINPNGTDPNTTGIINGGVGLKITISPQVAFRFDVRDIYTIVGSKQDFFLNGGVQFSI